MQASVAWLQRKVGPGLNSTTSLEDQIEELKATTVIVLNNHTSMLTVLEYRSDVAEDDIANHTSRLEEIEKNRKSDIAKLEAHFAKIIELEKADNESKAVLEMHSDALMSLGEGFVYMTSHFVCSLLFKYLGFTFILYFCSWCCAEWRH